MTVVYWLYDETCSDPWHDGYVGVSIDPVRRLYQHKKYSNFPTDVRIKIVFEGTTEECLEKEKEYRPEPYIGWNIIEGGGLPPNLKGRKHRPESIQKMKAIPRRQFTEEDYKKAALVNINRVRSKEELTRRSLSALGKNTWTKGRKIINRKRPEKFPCDYCGTFASKPLLKRWHNTNCREANNGTR